MKRHWLSLLQERIAVVVGAACIALAGRIVWASINFGLNATRCVLTVLLVTLGTLLVLRVKRAFRLAGVLALVVFFGLPIGAIDPEAIGDYAAIGREAPTVSEIVLWLVPAELVLLLVAFVLHWREAKPRGGDA